MDELLKSLAEVAMKVGAAEAALDEGAAQTAASHLDAADDGLAALRERWPDLDARERALLGRAARPVRERSDAARARLPRSPALIEGEPEHDPEQESEPEG